MSTTKVEALNALCEKLSGEPTGEDCICGALKAICQKACGTETEASTIVEAIDAVTAALPEGGIGGGEHHIVFNDQMTTFDLDPNSWSANIVELIIPEGVTKLENVYHTEQDDEGYEEDVPNLRDYNSLEKLVLPSTMTTFGIGAFLEETSVRELVISDEATELPYCYCAKSLEKVNIPKGVTSIMSNCFAGCRLSQGVDLPEGLKTIYGEAFSFCRFTEIDIPSTVETIATTAFKNSYLEIITVHKPEGSIAGAPWGATNAEVIWTG